MGADQIITDFKPVGGPIETPEIITDFKPVGGPLDTPDIEYREGRPYISVGAPQKEPELKIKDVEGVPPFDFDKHMWDWASTRDKEEEPPGDDVASSLWPVVRPFLASGATTAASLTQGMAAMAAHFNLIDEWAAKKSGGALKSGLDWKAAAERLDRDSQFWRERAAEVGANALDEFFGEFVGGGIPGIADFSFSLATGLTYPYMKGAAIAEKEGKNEVVAGMVEAMKTGTLAAIFKMIHPLNQWLRSPTMGTIFGIQAATEGAEAKEIVKAFATGAGYSLTSPGGKMGLNEVMQGLRSRVAEMEKNPPVKERPREEVLKEIDQEEVRHKAAIEQQREKTAKESPTEIIPEETAAIVKKRMGLFKEPQRQQGLISWLRSKGGINPEDPSADIRAWKTKESGYVGLISKKGRYIDELAQEWWWETGNKMTTDEFSKFIGDTLMAGGKKGKGKDIDSMTQKEFDRYVEAGQRDWAKFMEAEEMERQAGRLSIFGKKPEVEREKFSFSDPEMEARYQKSVPVKASPLWKLKEGIKKAWHLVTREYEHLPKGAEFAELRFRLKKLEKQKGVQAHNTAEEIAREISALDKAEYDLFSRKVILNDLWTEMERGHKLPWRFTAESLRSEMQRLNETIEKANARSVSEGRGPVIQNAMDRRSKDWDKLRTEYIAAMKEIDFDVEPLFKNERYFRHQVLSEIETEGLYGTGQKLKTPAGRGFLKRREGSTLDINRDFLIPEELVKAQMRYDIEIAKTIKWVDDNLNIARGIKRRAEAEGVKDWHKLIPDGYIAWQPREGNTFYMADSIPAKMARDLHVGRLKELGITENDLKPILAVGRVREEFVLKEEVAAQLDELVRLKTKGPAIEAVKETTKLWKVWQLISPRRWFKHNLRNASGDADATFIGNPRALRRAPQAIKEIWNVFVEKKDMTQEMKDWFERGGMESTLQAQELGGLTETWLFSRLYEKEGVKLQDIPYRVWKKYWETARMSTDMREAVLRYANYLEYVDQMKQSPGGVPKNFGASIPEEILALGDIKDRAYWLSNDLLGAYDRISVMGQNMREYWFPFWSWKEINFKRYIQLAKNAAYDKQLSEKVGRLALEKAEREPGAFVPTPKELMELREHMKASKGDMAIAAGKKGATVIAKSPVIAAKIGAFVLMATAFHAATEVYNRTLFPEEEEDLPEEERAKPHIILGRDEEGNVMSWNRLGSLGDFLEWFGMDNSPMYVRKWMNGEMTMREIIIEMAKSPVNIFAQNLRPDVKTGAELATQRRIFPDVFEPTTIRDRWLHLAQHFGLENEYIAISGLPSKGYPASAEKLAVYETDPGQAAYSEIMETKNRYLKEIGKGAEGFWLTPKGKALYNLKLAIKYQDQTALEKYMVEYFELGGTGKSMMDSIERMHPLAGLSKQDRGGFLASLSERQQKRLEKALEFYMTTLLGGKK